MDPKLPIRGIDYTVIFARQMSAMREFYASQKLPVASWSEHSVARLRGPSDLRGRHRLVEALTSLGFELL